MLHLCGRLCGRGFYAERIEQMKAARIRNPESINWTDRVNSILSSNAKIEKTPAGVPIINSGISLAPARRSGVRNVCAAATAGCIAACVLWFAGRTMTAIVRGAAIARTMLLQFSPAVFHARLDREIAAQERAADAAGARSFVRPNAASDEDYGPAIAARHPRTTFYDYSKVRQRIRDYLAGKFPPNYHVSYSVHEHAQFTDVAEFLRAGGNVVVVVDSYYWGPSKRFGTLPAAVEFRGPEGDSITVGTVDGDVADVRTPEFDGRGAAVCLRLKSQSNRVKENARKTGFARAFEFGGKEFSQRFTFPPARGTMIVELK
jgi:hypothetical protein